MDFDHDHADHVRRRRSIIVPVILIGIAIILVILEFFSAIIIVEPNRLSPYALTATYVEEHNRTAFFQLTSTAVTLTPVATAKP